MKRATLLFLAAACGLMLGCSNPNANPSKPTPEQMAAAMRNRGQAQKMSVEEIGKSAFGTAFRSARKEGATVLYEYAPNQDGAPENNYERIYLMAPGAVPSTFRSEPGVTLIRLTAVDAKQPSRRLAVYSITRAASARIDWMHGVRDKITQVFKTEYLDPSFQSFAKGR